MKGKVLFSGTFVIIFCLLFGCAPISGPAFGTGDVAGGDFVKDHGQKAEGYGQIARARSGSVPEYPTFDPWPPPRPSTFEVIPDKFLTKENAKPTLSDIDQKISAALDDNGYVEKSNYSIPDGFAIVTRLEWINEDGTPKQGQ